MNIFQLNSNLWYAANNEQEAINKALLDNPLTLIEDVEELSEKELRGHFEVDDEGNSISFEELRRMMIFEEEILPTYFAGV